MKAKAIKAFLALFSVLFITEAFFVFTHFFITAEYKRVNDNLVAEYQLTENTSELVNSFYDLIQYSNDFRRIDAFKDNLERLNALLAKLDKNLAGSESWAVYSGVRNTINVVIADVDKGLKDIAAGNFSEVTADYLKAAKDNGFVRENTGALLIKELEEAEKTQAALAKTKFWSELLALALLAGAFFGSMPYAFSVAKKLIDPVRRLADNAKNIADGNYEEKIDPGLKASDDEAATLARSLEKIAASLKESAGKMKAKDDQLAHIHDVLAEEGMPEKKERA